MSSKAKRPTLGDRLVRVKDILAIHRALLTRIEASERRIIALEALRVGVAVLPQDTSYVAETNATTD